MIILEVLSGSGTEPIKFGRVVSMDTWGASVIKTHLENAGLRIDVIEIDEGALPAEFDCFASEERGAARGYAEALTYVTGVEHDTFEVEVPESEDDDAYTTIQVLPIAD